MLCRCVENGQARVVGTNKITWFEKGMVADIIVDKTLGIPSHFVAVEEAAKEEKKGKTAGKAPLKDDDL